MLAGGLGGCSRSPQNPVRVRVVMKRYSFEPAVIRVKQGDWVELQISTADVQHGFDVPELKLREPVQPGRPVTVLFHAARRGTYRMQCSIICGPGHDRMTGSIVVE